MNSLTLDLQHKPCLPKRWYRKNVAVVIFIGKEVVL